MKHTIKYQSNLDDERRFIVEEQNIHYDHFKNTDLVSIDFENVQFVTPFCLLGILLNCKRISEKTKNKVSFINLNEKLFLYLNRMKFFYYALEWITVSKEYTELDPWSENPYSLNLLEISKIDKEQDRGSQDVLEVVGLLRERARDIFAVWLQKDIFEVDEFVTVLSEIAQNIFEHSRDEGYVALNKYHYQDKTRINLSIMDGGIGLFNSVKEKLAKKKIVLSRPSDYVTYPFAHGMARSGGGGGLVKVFDFIKRWEGSLFIRSETCCAFKRQNRISFEKRDNFLPFKGTHIGIWLESNSI